jgi:uncharacterized protein involved in exopolysaccharide biosynthesis
MTKEINEGKKYNFASIDLLIYIWEKRWPLAIITFIAGILSIIASYTITPMYKSNVVMFPTTNGPVSKSLLTSYMGKLSIYEIGEDAQTEQLLQVLNSEEIKNRIISKYKLMEHYRIDSTSGYPHTALNDMYNSNVHLRRTEFRSIQVDVLDRDPQTAADIANDISNFADTVYNKILKQRAVDAFLIVEKEYNQVQKNYDLVKDSIDKIRALGINNYNSQADRYHQAYATAILEGNSQAVKTFDEKFKVLSKYGGTYEVLYNQFIIAAGQLSNLADRYREAKVEVEQTLPHKFVVNKAFKAEKKSYPKKSIIVIVSTLSSFFIGLILLMISENFKKKLK